MAVDGIVDFVETAIFVVPTIRLQFLSLVRGRTSANGSSGTTPKHVQQTGPEHAVGEAAPLPLRFNSFEAPRLNAVAADDPNYDSFVSRRRDARVAGPFRGVRLGALNVPIRISDLSVGGCLIESLRKDRIGQRMRVEIDLLYEQPLSLEGELIDIRPDRGYAMRFVDQSAETKARLESVIGQLIANPAR